MPATSGDTVAVHYAGRLDDGTPFDSSEGRAPLSFTLGSGQVVPGFDAAVTGMEVGETKTVRLDAADAYGDRRDDLVMEVPKTAFPSTDGLKEGVGVQLGLQGGGSIDARVTEVSDDTITLDANHPLAGQALTFDLTLEEIAA